MNPFKQLIRLLPTYPLRVGEVISVDVGTAVVEEAGGGRETVRGEATIGQIVYFRQGVIEGEAPDLPLESVDDE